MSKEESILRTADSIRRTNTLLKALNKQPNISNDERLDMVGQMNRYKRTLVRSLTRKLEL